MKIDFQLVAIGAAIVGLVIFASTIRDTSNSPIVNTPAEAKQLAEQKRVTTQSNADDVIAGITYIRDPRPPKPICFAYLWGDSGYGGPALATVPCDAIPPNLLVTAHVK